MKIIIAGAGKVGASVAAILSGEGHDITIIDKRPDIINNISNNLDLICVQGSATSSDTLIEAGAREADLVLAATRNDEINMVCGISARKLGTKHVIARIRDTAYMHETAFLREALGLSATVNPEFECAREISRILRFPSANRVDTFAKGNAELVGHRVLPGSKLCGKQLKELPQAFGAKVLVGVVERKGEAIIPNGDFTIEENDRLSITGASKELRKFFTATGEYKKPVKKVMIMGGGRIAVYLAKLLIEVGISVTIVELNREVCRDLSDELPQARIINADASAGDVLLEEGLESMDAFVALTGDDGSNIITSIYAQKFNLSKIIVKVNREYYSEILASSGIESVVTPRVLVSQQLARYVRAMSNSVGSSMETLYRLADGKVEALEFIASENSSCVGKPLKDMKLKANIIVAALVRGKHTIIPDGNTDIHPGDHAIIIAKAGHLKELDAIVEVKR
ncbi:MAG: Trk system potassium transporter TrkA [Oscillospiraceae bacterium]|nr:Trk system potassium transporter TrkA [Oscillospiraceae bacterium]